MPTRPRSSSSAKARPVLVAAVSGRALAAAARRAGETVIVLDRFGDLDTRALAVETIALPWRAGAFARDALVAAVERFAGVARGLVYGGGFERDPALLAELARRLPLLGNGPETVAAVKDPMRFAALLARLGLPHPPTRLAPPREEGWLRKSIGAAGGWHIRPAEQGRAEPGCYYQRKVSGRPVSAAFLADGRGARLLAFSEQWACGSAAAPYRYGGCAGPVALPAPFAKDIDEACQAIAGALGLVGLNSLDLLVEEDRFWILEVNPRPGASLDALDGIGGQSFWRLHCAAVDGTLPARAAPWRQDRVRAAAIVYAPGRIVVPPAMTWPEWCSDRGPPGTVIAPEEPVATVHAIAVGVAAARALAEARAAALLASLRPPDQARRASGGERGREAALAQRQ